MSSYLEPSFLLELGAYAVAIAGIRIFKSRYCGSRAQPSADVTLHPEQPVAPGQAASPTVLGLGQASPLRVPPSPRRSSSPAVQTEPQLGIPVAPQPLHEEEPAATPFPTRFCPSPTRQAAGAAAPDSATGFDIGEAGLNADGDHAAADMADIGLRADTHGETPAATGAAQAAELSGAAAAATAAQEATDRASQTTEQRKAAVVAAAERQRLRRASQTAEQRAAALAAHAARQKARRVSPTAEQRAAALAANVARQRARRGDRCCDLVSEPVSAAEAPADLTGIQSEACTTAASEDDNQPASETLATTSEGRPTFKVVYVGDGGTTKVCGADLVAWAQRSRTNSNTGAEPAEDSSQDKAEATQQVQEEANGEGVIAMCECSDEEEGICAGISKDSSPRGFDLYVTHAMVPSSSTGAQRDSSAGLVTGGSESDGELQPAEEAVVTHRDILLRAAQRRKREITDSDCFMSDTGLTFMSRKKPCGSCAAGQLQAGRTEAMRPGSLDTSCMPGNKVGHQLLAGLPIASVCLQPTPLGGDVTPPGVGQNPSMGPNSTPASSDCQPQPQEEGEDQRPIIGRAMAPRPEAFLPIASSVFDEAPGPETAALFDAAPMPMKAVMFDDGQTIHAEEEEHRHASPEQPVEAMEDDSACEEHGQSQLQELDQAKADHSGQPTDSSPAAIGAAAEEEQVGMLVSLRDCPSPQPAAKHGEYQQVSHKQLSAAAEPELESVAEPVAEAASSRNRLHLDEGRYWRSRANSWQPTHSHKPNYLSRGYDHGPDVEPSADTDHPGEHDHLYRCGRLTQDQCTWESVDDARHDSSERHAQADRPQEEVWVLPQVDSAPPITPDSPHHSSAPPNSPSWGLSDDPWGSPSTAAPNSHPQSAWDSPPRAAPNSPALACAGARSGRSRRHTAPRAMSNSPAPRARSPYKASWRTPPRSQATTPMHESTPPSEGDPYGGDVAGALYGDYAHGSYAYPPPPPTPTSPSPPPSSPPHLLGTLCYEDFHGGRSWRHRALASRVPALGSPEPFPASPESPPHLAEPGRAAPDSPALIAPDDTQYKGEDEKHDPEAAVVYSHMEAYLVRAAATAANKPQQHDSSAVAKEGANATKQGAIQISSKHPNGTYEVHWPETFTSVAEAQAGEADPEGMGTEQGQGEGQGSPLPSRLPPPLGRGGDGQPGVQGAGSAEPMSPPHPPDPDLLNTQAEGGYLMDACAGCEHISQGTGQLEKSLEGAAAASSPEPVPDIQQSGEEEELAADPTDVRQGLEQGRAASFPPQPSPEHPLECASSESAFGESPHYPPSKIKGARGGHFDHDTGSPPSCPSRRQSLEQPVPKVLKKSKEHQYRRYESVYKCAYTSPPSSDNEEQAEDVHDNPSGDKAGGATDKGLQGGSNLGEVLERLEKALAGYGSCHRATAATSPEPVDLLQADEEEQVDGPGGDQGHEQDRPVAASGPQAEEPEMMVEDEQGDECYEDDEVQFVSETGPDPSRSAFASAVKRLAAEEDDVELLPGVQDLISGTLGSKHARHSRRSMADDEDDIGDTDRSRGRGSIRRRRGHPTSPEAKRSSPSQHGVHGFGRHHRQRSHSHDRQHLFCEEDEDVSPGRPASVCTATVSAAAGSRGAGAAATALGRHARRLRDMLSVAEEEDEEDDMDADMTCWRRLLKKSRHH